MTAKAPTAVKVFATATVANVACGFDILGFALNKPGDTVIVRSEAEPGVTITAITGDDGRLPLESERNTASVGVLRMLEQLEGGSSIGLSITLEKQMPMGSGLGSSAASSAAALVATNELLGRPLTNSQLIPFAMEAERVACGSAHVDNVAPALLGGVTLIRSSDPLDVIEIPVPDGLYCSVVYPHIEVRTEDARKILRRQVSLDDAIQQWGNTAALIAGFFKEDFELIGRSLQDVIIEPTRSLLIPNFARIKNAALAAGALGCSISGSGPSIFALCAQEEAADKIGQVMQAGFKELDVDSTLYISEINAGGPEVEHLVEKHL